MGTMKKIALTSAIGMSLAAGAAFAAPSAKMQGAADAKAKEIRVAVNNGAALVCNQENLKIAKAAVAEKGNAKGAELNAQVRDAVFAASQKYNLVADCMPLTLAQESSNIVTGMNSAKAGVLGKAPLAGAGALGGLFGGAGIASALVPLAVLGGVAAVASSDSDNKCASGDTSCE